MLTSDFFTIGNHNIGYVSKSFLKQFGKTTFKPVTVMPSFVTLNKPMNDFEIIERWKPQSTLGDVAYFIEHAPEECKDGRWNLFYIKGTGFVVHVLWDGSIWFVSAWYRDCDGWFGGERVFSPVTDSIPDQNSELNPSVSLAEAIKIVKAAGLKVWEDK